VDKTVGSSGVDDDAAFGRSHSQNYSMPIRD
jgi:hypothetical protein